MGKYTWVVPLKDKTGVTITNVFQKILDGSGRKPNKICKYMTTISKNIYINKLDDAVNKFNKTYLSIIKMSPVYVKTSLYTYFNMNNNKGDPKFKFGHHVRISKYKNIFIKYYDPKRSE